MVSIGLTNLLTGIVLSFDIFIHHAIHQGEYRAWELRCNFCIWECMRYKCMHIPTFMCICIHMHTFDANACIRMLGESAHLHVRIREWAYLGRTDACLVMYILSHWAHTMALQYCYIKILWPWGHTTILQYCYYTYSHTVWHFIHTVTLGGTPLFPYILSHWVVLHCCHT